jgi:Rho GDP-dissociation inhibitor
MASGDRDKHEHDSDDENSAAHGYKAPLKMDLGSIVSKDEDDEALTRYKKALLGNANDIKQTENQLIDPNDSRVVIPIRITLLFEKHKPDITFELKGSNEQLRDLHSKRIVTIKEGESYRTQLEYYVQRDIVTGLVLMNKVLKARTIPVDKSKYMIGKNLFNFNTKKQKKQENFHFRFKSTE